MSGSLGIWLTVLGGSSMIHNTLLAYRSLQPSVLGKKQTTCLLSSLCPTRSPCQRQNGELYRCASSPASQGHSALLCPHTGGPSALLFPPPPPRLLLRIARSLCSTDSRSPTRLNLNTHGSVPQGAFWLEGSPPTHPPAHKDSLERCSCSVTYPQEHRYTHTHKQ